MPLAVVVIELCCQILLLSLSYCRGRGICYIDWWFFVPFLSCWSGQCEATKCEDNCFILGVCIGARLLLLCPPCGIPLPPRGLWREERYLWLVSPWACVSRSRDTEGVNQDNPAGALFILALHVILFHVILFWDPREETKKNKRVPGRSSRV